MKRLALVLMLTWLSDGYADPTTDDYSRDLNNQMKNPPARCEGLPPAEYRICVAQVAPNRVPQTGVNLEPSWRDQDNGDRGDYLGSAADQARYGRGASLASYLNLILDAEMWRNDADNAKRAAGAQMYQAAMDYYNQSQSFEAAMRLNYGGRMLMKQREERIEPNASSPVGGNAADAPAPIAKNPDAKKMEDALMPDKLRKSLEAKGVDPDAFLAAAKNKEFSTPADMLRAMGDNRDYSEDELARGQEMADQRLRQAFSGEAPPAPKPEVVRGQMFWADSHQGGKLYGNPVLGLGSYPAKNPGPGDGADAKAGDLGSGDLKGAEAKLQNLMRARDYWTALGVQPFRRKNIFEIAKHEYRTATRKTRGRLATN